MNYYEIGSPEDIWVSSTGLKQFEKSPRGFLYWLGKESVRTPAMEFGTQLHKYFEAPSNFIIADFDKPTEQLCEWIENVYQITKGETFSQEIFADLIISTCNYKSLKDENKILIKFLEGQKYYDWLCESSTKIPLTKQDKVILEGIIQSYNEKFGWLKNAEREKEIFWTEQTKYGKVQCKAKIDEYFLGHVTDFKSTAGTAYVTLDKLIEWKYVRQLAFYMMGLERCGYEITGGDLKMCSKEAPFDVVSHYFSLNSFLIKGAQVEINTLLEEVAWCQVNSFTYSKKEENGRISYW